MVPIDRLESLRAKCPSKATQGFVLLASIFIAVLLLTNVITVKYFSLGGQFTLTAGAITYPFTFSLVDIISEHYGPKKAQLAVWMGLVGSLLMTVVLQFASQLPACAQSPVDQTTFQLIFGFTPGIVLGSMVAYLAAQFTDIYLFDWTRKRTQNKHLWLRNNVSTLISQLIDTLLFGLIAWEVGPFFVWDDAVAPLPWSAWYQIMINEYVFKVIFTILNTPLVYWGVYSTKHWGER